MSGVVGSQRARHRDVHPVVDAVRGLVTRRSARHLGNHYPVTIAAASTIVVAALLLVPFLASLRTYTARRTDVPKWRWAVTLVAGAIGIAMLALAGALLATATVLAERSTADDAVFAVFVAAKLVATLALLPVAGLVLANARTIATTQRRPERWLIRFDIEIAAMVVVASVVSFVHHDWLGPGEPVVAGAWFLVWLWVFALARTIVRGDHDRAADRDRPHARRHPPSSFRYRQCRHRYWRLN